MPRMYGMGHAGRCGAGACRDRREDRHAHCTGRGMCGTGRRDGSCREDSLLTKEELLARREVFQKKIEAIDERLSKM